MKLCPAQVGTIFEFDIKQRTHRDDDLAFPRLLNRFSCVSRYSCVCRFLLNKCVSVACMHSFGYEHPDFRAEYTACFFYCQHLRGRAGGTRRSVRNGARSSRCRAREDLPGSPQLRSAHASVVALLFRARRREDLTRELVTMRRW